MNQYRITIDGNEKEFIQEGEDTILRAALRSGHGFPYECNSGGCGGCKFDLLAGEVENLWPDAPGLTERDKRKKLLLACQCRAKTNVTVKARTGTEYIPPVSPARVKAKFLGSSNITHDIRELRFKADKPADFLAGQYAILEIPNVGASRSYSMSNLPNSDGEWHFMIRRVMHGKATDQLFNHLKIGDEIEIDGPYGMAWLREDCPRDIVCIAGGSGLAPMISIARRASKLGMLLNRNLHFFYGGRTSRDICGENFLKNLPEFGNKIHFYPIVSLPEEQVDIKWSGETGYVHDAVSRLLSGKLADFEFYYAGPPPMTQALQEMLMIGHKVPFEQIHFDRFF